MSQPFIAEIRMFGGNFAPRGWAFCNGQIMSIAQNTALFSLLGVTYGGNGQTTFGLPDLRGRASMHPGQGPGVSPRSLGEQGGSPTVTLIQTEIPAHTHTFSANGSDPGEDLSPGPSEYLSRSAGGLVYSTSSAPPVTLNPATISPAGGSQPHNNRQPYLGITFIIAMQGVYPSRN